MSKQEILYNNIPRQYTQGCKHISIEECSELTKEICKSLRNKTRREKLIEEIVDVEICINWLKSIYNISEQEMIKWKEYKEDRLIQRYNNNKFY